MKRQYDVRVVLLFLAGFMVIAVTGCVQKSRTNYDTSDGTTVVSGSRAVAVEPVRQRYSEMIMESFIMWIPRGGCTS